MDSRVTTEMGPFVVVSSRLHSVGTASLLAGYIAT